MAISNHQSVGQQSKSGTGHDSICRSSSSLATEESPQSAWPSSSLPLLSKQDPSADKTAATCCADAVLTASNSVPNIVADHCRARLADEHGNNSTQRCFKFTEDELVGADHDNNHYHHSGYQAESPHPPPAASSKLSPSSLKTVSPSHRRNNAHDELWLANANNINIDNNHAPSKPESKPSSTSLICFSSESTATPLCDTTTTTLKARSCRAISSTMRKKLRKPSGPQSSSVGELKHRLQKFRGATCKPRAQARFTRSALALGAILIGITQLYALISAPLVAANSADYANSLPPNAVNDNQPAARLSLDSLADSWRSSPQSVRDERQAEGLANRLPVNMSNVFEMLFKKRPYSKYWTVEQKWDDLFRRGMAAQAIMRQAMVKNFMKGIEYYTDISLSPSCERDLKYVQNYASQSTNFRWLGHMFDSAGKSEPGMLTGMLSNLGHPVQCVKVRAPARPSNDTFDERFFEEQTRVLGERFRGQYCLLSVRPVLPTRPSTVISRFSDIFNATTLSNISYTGESEDRIKQRARQMHVPKSTRASIDRKHIRLDQVPFESELYEYLIQQRNFMYSLPRFIGVCYPSSCSREDVRMSIQRTMDDQHQVVDLEFDCEQEEVNSWDWFITPRLIAYVAASLVVGMVFLASLTRYILLSKLQIKRAKLKPASGMANLLDTLDMFSVDKCAGILFVKTKTASTWVDWTKVENNRSSTIDAVRGFLIMVLVYSQLTVLGCLPVPFMWSKWSDAMFPFYRSMITQPFINMSIWSEAFYMISSYIIALKVLENYRPKPSPASGHEMGANNLHRQSKGSASETKFRMPNLFSFVLKRYLRLILPMTAFILFNYVWPRLSNGFVMQDQARKIMKPCDSYGWTNFLLFHNQHYMNETCLWPSHVSASFFQLHLLSYPILVLCLMALYSQYRVHYGEYDENKQHKKFIAKVLICCVFGVLALTALVGAIYPALQASGRSLIVPFLIDYIDFDNYQRVIEWMVVPTYNHLTSYMFGIGVAFMIIRRRAHGELQKMQASQWGLNGLAGQYHHRDGSIDSIRSSSTQELNQQEGLTFKTPFSISINANHPHMDGHQIHQKQFNISTGSSESSERRYDDGLGSTELAHQSGLVHFIRMSLCIMVCIGSLVASWFWTGLGQPMSDQHTFWFVVMTKLVFCASFAYLFMELFATRRNSSNPWMTTRFLVPIGRMSLTVFYMSWLVIWFDLLSSLYQWHPSHYFISEKYFEIIFITLIISMFVYAAFEGIVKRIQYSSRSSRLRHDVLRAVATTTTDSANSQSGAKHERNSMRPFESFFDPEDKPSLIELQREMKLGERSSAAQADVDTSTRVDGSNNQYTVSTISSMLAQQTPTIGIQGADQQANTGDKLSIGGGGVGASPSLSDRYKLNAELRANYSYASIGLYECAGATGDLTRK